MKINIINCFSTHESNSGNPAAITRYFQGNKDDKQILAKRLNLPVSIFLSEVIDGNCHIEYFYPETEMALCLHGTVGAAYILSKEIKLDDLIFLTKDKKELKTRIVDNIIQVLVSSQSSPSLSIDKLQVCNMLDVKEDDIDLESPFLISSVGSPKLLIPLKSFESLGLLKPKFNLITDWSIKNAVNGFYVYTKDINRNDFHFYARGFNPKSGHQEDAATGVAAAALSLALKQSIVVGQGIFLNRPSKIIVSYENPNNIWIGGSAREQIKYSEIRFKKMDEEDLYLLHEWFQIPHVLKWYARGESYTLKMIKEKYLPRINDATVSNFIIYANDKAVGYIQLYFLTDHYPEGIKNNNHPIFKDFTLKELAGIDLFIAEKDYLHIGFSSKALNEFIRKYIKGRFKAVLVDPDKENNMAIRFFEKNGFMQILSQDNQHDLMINNIVN